MVLFSLPGKKLLLDRTRHGGPGPLPLSAGLQPEPPSAFQSADLSLQAAPAPYAHAERKPYAAYPCAAYKLPALIPLSRRLSAGSFSYLHKQANRTHTLKSRRGYAPATGACRLPGHFQSDVVPPVREQGRKALPGMYPVPLQEQTGVRIFVCRIGELKLCDPLFIPAHAPLLSPLKQGENPYRIFAPVLAAIIRYSQKAAAHRNH